MRRYEILQQIAPLLHDQLVVCNIGIPSKELYYLNDRDKNFYMLGSMGLASSIALGLAIARPEKQVWCIEGDGSLLMNLGSLSTIAHVNPKNLALIVIDNGAYGSTGNQKTHTRRNARLDVIARGAGFDSIHVMTTESEIAPVLEKLGEGCHFVLIKARPGNEKVPAIPLDAKEIKDRFIRSLDADSFKEDIQ